MLKSEGFSCTMDGTCTEAVRSCNFIPARPRLQKFTIELAGLLGTLADVRSVPCATSKAQSRGGGFFKQVRSTSQILFLVTLGAVQASVYRFGLRVNTLFLETFPGAACSDCGLPSKSVKKQCHRFVFRIPF